MKRARFVFPLALLFALGLAVRPAAAQLGIAGGLNFENFTDIEFTTDTEAAVEGSTGYHIGVFYDLAVGPLALRPGVFYRQTGDFGVDSVTDFDLSLIEIPVDVRFRFGPPLVPIKPYALAGPVFSIPSTDNNELEDAVVDFTVSGAVGLGLEVSLVGTGIRLFPEIRYQFGLSDYIEDGAQIGPAALSADTNENLSAFMIRLGVAM